MQEHTRGCLTEAAFLLCLGAAFLPVRFSTKKPGKNAILILLKRFQENPTRKLV